ncbi:MAG: acyltransferase family protein [Bacteroides sp.]|nr:acyltransferase family protein [Bacteroides sp.]
MTKEISGSRLSAPSVTSGRSLAIDVIKALCIILMVVGHSGAPADLEKMISSFHIPAFFIVSGFLLKPDYTADLRGFARKRMKSIWWPFVFWTIVFILLHNAFAYLQLYPEPYAPKEFAHHLIKGILMLSTEQLLGGFWFLVSLLFASVFSILWLRITRFTRAGILGGIGLCLLLTVVLSGGLLPEFLYFNSHNFFSTAFFLTGTFMAREKLQLTARRKAVVAGAIVSLVIGTFWIRRAITNITPEMTLPYYLTATFITWGLIIVFWRLPSEGFWRYLAMIGSRTLDILIFHFLTFKVITWLRVTPGSLPASALSEFPVPGFPEVMQDSGWFWLVYSLAGISIPLLLSVGKDRLNRLLGISIP